MSQTILRLRAAIRDRLMGATSVGLAVSTNRADHVWSSTLPCIVVYTRSERLERVEDLPPSYDCTVSVGIDVLAAGEDNLPMDDQIDRIAGEVRAVMARDARFNRELPGVIVDARLASYEVTVEAGGELLVAGGRLAFEFLYREDPPDGDPGDLRPLKQVSSVISLDNNDVPEP